MRISEGLVIGHVYTRAELKEQFGIIDATINNGIYWPKGHESVWLFVTRDKTSDRTQYHDELDGDSLTMQGQIKGGTDHLIADHRQLGVELLLFYRVSKNEHPGAGFVYEGPFHYVSHTGALPTTFQLARGEAASPARKRTWDLTLEAVVGLGGSATPREVRDYILAQHPDYNTGNVQPDLSFLSVNSPSRTSYHHNGTPRRTDEGNEYDRLFKVGSGKDVYFEVYDPAEHGVWEIYEDPAATSSSGMSVRQAVSPVDQALGAAETEAEGQATFDAQDVQDARQRVMASIVRRRGQREFRSSLVAAYGGSCAVTGCSVAAILEAAHIHPYRGAETNVVSNGLLLRADIHTLFDLGLLAIEPETFVVRVAPELRGTEYEDLDGRPLREPEDLAMKVSGSALGWHRSRCGW